MKIIRKEKSKTFKNSENCTAIEYPMGDKDINGAVIKLDGRYPEKGRVVNMECKELAYILEGFGKIVIEGKEIQFKQGDLLLLEPKEKYFWEGNCKMFVPCVPAWWPEQHMEVE
jgi:mannose-6-phosphate isomerase-like protein (cupin superfamily)